MAICTVFCRFYLISFMNFSFLNLLLSFSFMTYGLFLTKFSFNQWMFLILSSFFSYSARPQLLHSSSSFSRTFPYSIVCSRFFFWFSKLVILAVIVSSSLSNKTKVSHVILLSILIIIRGLFEFVGLMLSSIRRNEQGMNKKRPIISEMFNHVSSRLSSRPVQTYIPSFNSFIHSFRFLIRSSQAVVSFL